MPVTVILLVALLIRNTDMDGDSRYATLRSMVTPCSSDVDVGLALVALACRPWKQHGIMTVMDSCQPSSAKLVLVPSGIDTSPLTTITMHGTIIQPTS